MKKALHRKETAFLHERGGALHPDESNIGEMIAAINRGMNGELGGASPMPVMLKDLHGLICRYLEEGATDDFLNELNSDLRHVQYRNYVVPADFLSPEGEDPQSIYVANMDIQYTPEVYAAREFSRIVTYGLLSRVRRCQLPGCENIFLGPPQRKWCTNTCGSKYRVGKKRKRDSA